MKKEEKINILFLLPNFDTGGSEKLVVDLAEHLDPQMFHPVVCAFFSGVYEARMKEKNIPFYEIHGGGHRRSKWQIVAELNKILRQEKIDIVNSHHTMTLLQGLPSFKLFNRIRVIHTEHTKLSYDELVTPAYMRLESVFLKFVDVALGISQGVCDYFRKELKVDDKKIVKILNGIAVERFQLSNRIEIRQRKRKELGLNDDEIAIGLCANFRKQKNHPLLVRAARNLKQRKIKFKVCLCGIGPEEESIRKLVQDLNLEQEVLFLGARLDIPELLQAFDIYCLPSFFEGLPFSLMEAAAAGLPAVATNVDGNNEVVVHEQTGLLVENNNEEMLSKALERLIKDGELRARMHQESLKVAERFSFQTMIREYEDLFRKWGGR